MHTRPWPWFVPSGWGTAAAGQEWGPPGSDYASQGWALAGGTCFICFICTARWLQSQDYSASTAGALGAQQEPRGQWRRCHRVPLEDAATTITTAIGAFYLVPLAVVDLGWDHGVGVTASQVVTEVGQPMSQLNGGEVRVVDPSHVEEQARRRFCPHFELNREPGEETRAKRRTTSVFLLSGPG